MSDRVDTRTDIQALREYADPEVSMLGTVDMVVIEGIADLLESLAAERDELLAARKALIDSAWKQTNDDGREVFAVEVDDWRKFTARSVLDGALGEGEDHD